MTTEQSPKKRRLSRAKDAIKRNPIKTVGVLHALGGILSFIILAAPLCPVLPPPYAAVCRAVTIAAQGGIHHLDGLKLDDGTPLDVETVGVDSP